MRFEDMSEGAVMMMPDEVFGRRWWVSAWVVGAAGYKWFMSIDAFPELAVVWAVSVRLTSQAANQAIVGLRLGDAVPTAAAGFLALEPLLPTLVAQNNSRSAVNLHQMQQNVLLPMRVPVRTASRQLVVEVVSGTATTPVWNVGVLVSGWPVGEVPSWVV